MKNKSTRPKSCFSKKTREYLSKLPKAKKFTIEEINDLKEFIDKDSQKIKL